VIFTAAGQGAANYQYEFWLTSGSTSTMVQAYSTTATWTLPTTTPAGTYYVGVNVRTSTGVARDASNTIIYVIQ
jgi:hypothetical protein